MIVYETNDELMHYGVLGMKWGVRRATRKMKGNSKRSNSTKGSRLFSKQIAILDKMLDSSTSTDPSKFRSRLDDIDNSNINYNTKYMNNEQKKIYSLNYYNDRKTINKENTRKALDAKKKLNSSNYTRSDQFAINLMGSEFANKVANIQLKNSSMMYDHYSKKVDALLNEIGDTKLSTIKSWRTVNDGNTVYSWYGDEYIKR